jgi:hypothetical protein
MPNKHIGICWECGTTANALTCLKRYGVPPLKVAFSVSTWGVGECRICKRETEVTEERDFFYPEFELIEEIVRYFKKK